MTMADEIRDNATAGLGVIQHDTTPKKAKSASRRDDSVVAVSSDAEDMTPKKVQ
jgi:hypothetical protein